MSSVQSCWAENGQEESSTNQCLSLGSVASSSATARSERWNYTSFIVWYLLNGCKHSVADNEVASHVHKSQLDHTPNLPFPYKLRM